MFERCLVGLCSGCVFLLEDGTSRIMELFGISTLHATTKGIDEESVEEIQLSTPAFMNQKHCFPHHQSIAFICCKTKRRFTIDSSRIIGESFRRLRNDHQRPEPMSL